MNKTLYNYHPISLMIYFVGLIIILLIHMNPMIIFISLFYGMIYYHIYLKKQILKNYFWLFVFVAMINPLFHHEGITILFYLPSGNAFTLESLIYGIFQSSYFISILIWFMLFQKLCDSEKQIYLFSKISKKLALFLSMLFRLVPYFQNKYEECLFVLNSNHQSKMNYFKAFSMVITHALNYAHSLQHSMKIRGYGIQSYHHYHHFQFHKRDIILLFISVVLFLSMIFFKDHYFYYPMLILKKEAYVQALLFLGYGSLILFIELRGNYLWNSIKSKT